MKRRDRLIPIVLIAALAFTAPGAANSLKPKAKKAQTGMASFYHKKFGGRKTASGERLKLGAATAASPTLPLGTEAKVVNLDTGKSARVTITDRGPYADGRVIDVTPKVAERLDMVEEGVAPVKVQPLSVPERD